MQKKLIVWEPGEGNKERFPWVVKEGVRVISGYQTMEDAATMNVNATIHVDSLMGYTTFIGNLAKERNGIEK